MIASRRHALIPRPQLPLRIEEALGSHWDRVVSDFSAPYHELLDFDPRGRVDSARSAQAKHLLDKAKRKMERKLHEARSQVEGLAGEFGKRTSDFQRSQFARQAGAALGINLYEMKDADVGDHLRDFVRDNVHLITSVPADQHDAIEEEVMESVHAGTRHEVLQKRLRERFGMSARRARLIARDQTTKLYSRVGRARTENLGIHRYTWSTMNDERVRDSHWDLEGTVWSFEHPPLVDGEYANPGEPVQCFPRGTVVSCQSPVNKAFRRRYRGEGSVLLTDEGRCLTSTPNHPVLTLRGWVPSHEVKVGDYVIEARTEGSPILVENCEQTQSRVEDLFSALLPILGVTRASGLAGQFHGDGSDEEVQVIDVERRLRVEGDVTALEEAIEHLLIWPYKSGPSRSNLDLSLMALGVPPDRVMRCFGPLGAFLGAGLSHPVEHRLRSVAWLDAIANELAADGGAAHVEVIRDALLRPPVQDVEGPDMITRVFFRVARRSVMQVAGFHTLSSEDLAKTVRVHADDSGSLGDRVLGQKISRVREHRSCQLDTHVYNFQTQSGWYVAQNLIVHNCRCYADPVWDDVLA